MKNATKLLTCARDKIKDPANWIKGAYARAAHESAILEPTDTKACRWCSAGALRKCSSADDNYSWSTLKDAFRLLGSVMDPSIDRNDWEGAIIRCNDAPQTNHEQVIGWFDKAIENSEART